MLWLIAWLLMLFTAVSSVSGSGTEAALPIAPDPGGAPGQGVIEPDCDLDVAMPGGSALGSPGIDPGGTVQPVSPEPVTVEPETAVTITRCGQALLPPDTIVVSPPPDGSVTPPGPAFPPIEPGLPDVDDDRALRLAPIEGVELVVREIWPPQYVAQVTSALPDGCSRFAGYTVEHDGTTITIEVWNSVPTGLVPCTMQYGYHPFSIELGSDFDSGEEYTLVVGDRELTFIAQ